MVKVLIVDDHNLVRIALRRVLKDVAGIIVAGEACNGLEAIKLCRELKPNVVLMDIQMPVMDGLEATRRLFQLDPTLRVLILTTIVSDVFVTRLLQIGAAGYITKNTGLDELIRAIQMVSKGERYLNSEMANQLALKRITNDRKSPFEALANRELDVARCISQGMSVLDTAKKLSLTNKTVNGYRYQIFEKLKIKTDVELAILAVRYNLIDLDPVLIGICP